MTLPPAATNQYSSPRLPAEAGASAWPAVHLSRWRRGTLLGFGLLLVLLLGTARWLTPSATGHGTHQQLGLPPCSFQTYTGVRCPACGMTTAWAHTVRGQVLAALAVNTGGTLLALLALVYVPWLVVSGIRGRWLWPPPGEMTVVIAACGISVVTLVDWGIRLAWKL